MNSLIQAVKNYRAKLNFEERIMLNSILVFDVHIFLTGILSTLNPTFRELILVPFISYSILNTFILWFTIRTKKFQAATLLKTFLSILVLFYYLTQKPLYRELVMAFLLSIPVWLALIFSNKFYQKIIIGDVLLMAIFYFADYWLHPLYFEQNESATSIYLSITTIAIALSYVVKSYRHELIKQKENVTVLESHLNNLISSISHEVRTPLSGLNFAMESAKPPKNEKDKALFDIFKIGIKNLNRVVKDMVEFQKFYLWRVNMSEDVFNMKENIEDCIELFIPMANSKGKKLKINLQYDDYHIISDKYRIAQVINNIIQNAIAHTAAESVEIETSYVVNNPDSLKYLIRVTDYGGGLHSLKKGLEGNVEMQEEMSDNFLGAGLLLNYKIIERLNGKLIFIEKNKVCTKVEIELPLKIAERVSKDRIKENDMDQYFKSLKYLVAEDDIVSTMAMKKFFRNLDIDATFKENGIELYKEYVNRFDYYDILLVDVRMPVMNGLEAAKRIRAFEASNNLQPKPIVAITANVLESDKQDCFEAGMNAFLNKPFNLEDFNNTLKSLNWKQLTSN